MQVGRIPKLLVWDTHTQVTQSELLGHFGGVSHCAFSPVVEGSDGRYVASVGLDAMHSVIVHDWKSGDIIAKCPGSPEKTFDISWNPAVSEHLGQTEGLRLTRLVCDLSCL